MPHSRRPIRLLSIVGLAALAGATLLAPTASAWWPGPRIAVGIRIPLVVPIVPLYPPPRPIAYPPPYYAPYAPYVPARIWIPAHFTPRGIFIPGHFIYR